MESINQSLLKNNIKKDSFIAVFIFLYISFIPSLIIHLFYHVAQAVPPEPWYMLTALSRYS
jgi:hypothetical protein